jgi:hypothetical protein
MFDSPQLQEQHHDRAHGQGMSRDVGLRRATAG